ncbi:hypothetical protein GGH95_005521 [Coemansia sp. RSA 1836]|nr:hypothetical protein GGH95_005521 [Coemansia sp. RSA 1836]
MSLGQPPPHLHGQTMSHQPLLDTLDPNIAPGDQHAHVHHASSFGFQQQFSGPSMHLAHSHFSPANPGGVPNLHTPTAPFAQTPQEDSFAQAHGAPASYIADPLHFEHALSTIDPTAMAGGSGQLHGLVLGRSTPQTLDASTRAGGYAGDLDRQGAGALIVKP